MANYFGQFSVVIISSLLLHNNGFVHGRGVLRSAFSESLEDNEIEHSSSVQPCSCQNEISFVKKQLETLELAFAEYKKSEDDRHFYLTARTEIIAKELVKIQPIGEAPPDNLQQIIHQADFIQENVIDPNSLKQIAKKIWAAVLALPGITTDKMFGVFENTFQSSPSLFVPMYEYLFDHLDATDALSENLSKTVEYLKSMLDKAKTLPSIAWTEELQIKLLQRIFVNINDWSDAFILTSSKFFDSFPSLSEMEAFNIALKVVGSRSEELLTIEELNFVKRICLKSKICANQSMYAEDASRKVFLKSKIQASIKNEILSQVRSNFTDASRIGLEYFRSWKLLLNGSNSIESDSNGVIELEHQSDILRSFAADVFLESMQNGVMTFVSNDANFFKFLQILGRSRKVVEKYPIFTQEFQNIVVRKFRHNFTNFESIREFLESVDKVSVPIEVWKFFVESMRENHQLNGNEAFQLGELLAEGNRNAEAIWDELPLPVKLLFESLHDAKWRVKVHRGKHSDVEFFDIVCNPDLTIGLVPVNSTGSYSKVWKFDKYDPWFTYKRLDVGYSEVSGNLVTFTIQAKAMSSKGKVILGEKDTDGNRLLKQSLDFVGPEKDGLTFNVFKPSLNTNLQVFHLSLLMVSEDMPMTVERFLNVLYDSENNPVGLGISSGRNVKAEFVLSKEI